MSERRRIFGEKFIDLGNYTIVALIFGQLVIEKRNIQIIALATVLVLICWGIGYKILKEKRRRKK